MSEESQHKTLTELEAKVREAKAASAPKPTTAKGSQIGFEFTAAVLGGALLGWLVDRELGTKPWGILVMLLLGVFAGIVNVWRALSSSKS